MVKKDFRCKFVVPKRELTTTDMAEVAKNPYGFESILSNDKYSFVTHRKCVHQKIECSGLAADRKKCPLWNK